MDIKAEREILFDENWKCKSKDIERVKAFCNELKMQTGIQVGNHLGMTYEYLPKVYETVINHKNTK